MAYYLAIDGVERHEKPSKEKGEPPKIEYGVSRDSIRFVWDLHVLTSREDRQLTQSLCFEVAEACREGNDWKFQRARRKRERAERIAEGRPPLPDDDEWGLPDPGDP